MNMDFEKRLAEFMKKAQKITLKPDEKSKVLTELVSFMEKKPVRKEGGFRLYLQRPQNLFSYFLTPKTMPVALLFLLFAGFGTSFAAESALPGDVLYSVKIHVNERVQSLIAVSDEAQARLDSDLAARRLKEAEELAAKGELDAKRQALIEKNFKAHADRVKERIAKFQAKSKANMASDASSHFESSLRAHQAILLRLKSEAKENGKDVLSAILEGIGVEVNAVVKIRLEAEEKISEKRGKGKTMDEDDDEEDDDREDQESEAKTEAAAAAEGKLKAANNKIDETKRFLKEHKGELRADAEAKVSQSLDVAVASVNEGKVYFSAFAYGDAFVSFQKAHRQAQETKEFMKTLLDLREEQEHDDENKDEEDEKESDDKDQKDWKDRNERDDNDETRKPASEEDSDSDIEVETGFLKIKGSERSAGRGR